MPKLNTKLHREVKAYLDELHAIKAKCAYTWRWVYEDNLYNNDWYYAFEGGILMDTISALRLDDDFAKWIRSMSPKEFEEQFGGKPLNGRGVRSNAVLFSLIEAAKKNRLDPYRYLIWVLTETPKRSRGNVNWAATLLPWCVPESSWPSS